VVVINGKRTTAIVIRHKGDSVTLVPMKSGRLSAKTVAFDEFRREWTETGYALSQALTTFLTHMHEMGRLARSQQGPGKARRARPLRGRQPVLKRIEPLAGLVRRHGPAQSGAHRHRRAAAFTAGRT
jgi:hypothetical protein